MDALVDFDAHRSRDERFGKTDLQIVAVIALFTAYLKHIAKAACGDQAGACALALNHRVDDQRCAVHEYERLLQRARRHGLQFAQARFDGSGRVIGRCQDFLDIHLA